MPAKARRSAISPAPRRHMPRHMQNRRLPEPSTKAGKMPALPAQRVQVGTIRLVDGADEQQPFARQIRAGWAGPPRRAQHRDISQPQAASNSASPSFTASTSPAAPAPANSPARAGAKSNPAPAWRAWRTRHRLGIQHDGRPHPRLSQQRHHPGEIMRARHPDEIIHPLRSARNAARPIKSRSASTSALSGRSPYRLMVS